MHRGGFFFGLPSGKKIACKKMLIAFKLPNTLPIFNEQQQKHLSPQMHHNISQLYIFLHLNFMLIERQHHLTVLIVLFVIGNTLCLCQGKQHSCSKTFPLLTIVFLSWQNIVFKQKNGKIWKTLFFYCKFNFLQNLFWGKTKNLQFFHITKWEVNLLILNFKKKSLLLTSKSQDCN